MRGNNGDDHPETLRFLPVAVSDVRRYLDVYRGRVLPSTWTDNVPAMLGGQITTFCRWYLMATPKASAGAFGKPRVPGQTCAFWRTKEGKQRKRAMRRWQRKAGA